MPNSIQFLAYLWAFPNTVIGLIVGTLTLFTGGKVKSCEGALEFWGGFAKMFLASRFVGARAMTLGHVILGKDEICLDALREHEHVHVKQTEMWGPFFLPAYFIASAIAVLKGGNSYNDNWFELDAERKCKKN